MREELAQQDAARIGTARGCEQAVPLTSYVSASGGVLVRIRSANPSGSSLCIQQTEHA
jgi:hypothetical protein